MIFLPDFETTGLVKDGVIDFLVQPGIVQIGAVTLDAQFNIVRRLNRMCNPEIPLARWEPGAMKVHGITPDKVANEPTFFALFDEFAEMAEGCDTWSGYNTKFDQDVLWHQLLRYGFERRFPWPRKEVDVMKLASHRMAMEGKRGTKRPKLIEIYEHLFKESFDGQHDAMADTEATARVLKELSK